MQLEDLYRLMKTGHVQAQGVVDTMTQPVVVIDENFCVTTANNAFIKAFKVERDDIIAQSFFGLGNGQWDIPELRQLISAIIPRAAAVIGFEVTHDFPAIGPRTFLIDARRLLHPNDNSPNILIIFDDVTERHRHDAEMDFIVAELRHRMKNMAAVVRSVVINTRADQPAVAIFKEALVGRLDATFKAQDIAARAKTADFEFLVTQAVGTTVSERLECSGPAVEMPSAKVLPVSMIFHELATNAVKHGAISTSAGRIRVSWCMETGPNGRQLLACQWQEEGGPSVSAPKRKGYGTELIEGLGAHIAGSAELVYRTEGLAAVIKIPV
ncbi:HWE histidine kinase domain-containing protein [Rhizobium sp. BK399]|uniref:HWE histidine kinase domain-containing protein n=1 Tax=Rhizobium sp. BK399 TaxID=2587063 RepID=UPI0016192A8E|nr:HWE histidine kinase domain-containing protein [Rhizobium sp. BK399]MBB3543860.1 two-component sensor histidine kinase [Rhizobium sp. BK399]